MDDILEIIGAFALTGIIMAVLGFAIFGISCLIDKSTNEATPIEPSLAIMETKHSNDVESSDTGRTLPEKPIWLDSDKYEPEGETEFAIMLEGQKIGVLEYRPSMNKYGVKWYANVSQDFERGCYGYGSTAGAAIKNAMTEGIQHLYEAASFAKKNQHSV